MGSRSLGRHVLLGSMTSSRTSTTDSRLACAEDAESDCATLHAAPPRAPLGRAGRASAIDVAHTSTLREPLTVRGTPRPPPRGCANHDRLALRRCREAPMYATCVAPPAASAATRSSRLSSAPSRRSCRRNKLVDRLAAGCCLPPLLRCSAARRPRVRLGGGRELGSPGAFGVSIRSAPALPSKRRACHHT